MMDAANFGSNISNLAHSTTDKRAGPFGQTVSNMAHDKQVESRRNLDAAIVDAQLSLSSADGNHSLTLVLKTAIEGINAELEPSLGANALETAIDSGLDFSPEATAERIVSLSTAFFGTYQQANPDLDFNTALDQFVGVISSGINQGFTEAREILTGLQVLEGDIASNIDLTYERVQQKLTDFAEALRAAQETGEESAALLSASK